MERLRRQLLYFKKIFNMKKTDISKPQLFFRNCGYFGDYCKFIRDEIKQLETCTVSMSNIMNDIYSKEGLQQIPLYCSKARENLPIIQRSYENIKKAFPDEDFFKYNFAWKTHTSQIAEWILLIIFLERGELCLKKEFSEMIGVENDTQLGFHITLEEYLFGYLSMISDLARLLVVSATYKDYGRTEQIHKFLKRSNDCFSLLNLKNDALRKRGDALKYDLKKAEEVISDLRTRGHLASI